MLFFGYSPMAPYLRYSEVNAAGELVHSTEIDIPAPVMMHDFVITENYAIFLDAPSVFDLEAIMTGGDPLSWKPENGTRIGIIPRGGSERRRPLVRGRQWLRRPLLQCLGVRQHDRDPCAADGGHAGRVQLQEPGCRSRADAVALGDRSRRPERSPRDRPTTSPASSLASTSTSPAGRPGTATPARSARGISSSTSRASSSTTSKPERRRATTTAPRRSAVSTSSPPIRPAPPRTTGG